MTDSVQDISPDCSLRAAILHYFQWHTSVAATQATAAAAAASRASAENKDDDDNENAAERSLSKPKGEKVIAALLEEFPELGKFSPPDLPVPELKVRFDAYPFHRSRLMFLENQLALAAAPKKPAATKQTPSNSKRKRKDPPNNKQSSAAKRKQPRKEASVSPKPAPSTSVNPKLREHELAMAELMKARRERAQMIPAAPPKKRAPPIESLPFEKRYEQLVHFHKGYGHARVPISYTATPGLARWVAITRQHYKEGKLTPEQITKLEELDFAWVVHDGPKFTWEERYEQLKKFKETYGHARVPYAYKPDPRLGEWVHRMRADYRNKMPWLMETDRLQKLEAIGFEWLVQRGHKSWNERFEQLVEFRRTHGHTNVPVPQKTKSEPSADSNKDMDEDDGGEGGGGGDDGGKHVFKKEHSDEDRFARWVQAQRKAYWKYKKGDRSALTQPRFKKLDDLGFAKESEGTGKCGVYGDRISWNERFEHLRRYKEQHGDCCVPHKWEEDKGLADWVINQRKHYRLLVKGKKSPLKAGQKQLLESLDFEWVRRPWMLEENRKKKAEETYRL